MLSSFAKKLGFYIHKTNVNIQKIDCNRPGTFNIVIAFFSVNNKNKKFCFFKKTFVLADISMNIAFEIFFLILNNVEVNFTNCKLK